MARDRRPKTLREHPAPAVPEVNPPCTRPSSGGGVGLFPSLTERVLTETLPVRHTVQLLPSTLPPLESKFHVGKGAEFLCSSTGIFVETFASGEVHRCGSGVVQCVFIYAGIYYFLSKWLTFHFSWGQKKKKFEHVPTSFPHLPKDLGM